MTHVVRVPCSDGILALERSVNELTMKERDLALDIIEHVFPLLDMKAWLEHLLEAVPVGRTTSFGALAEALGSIKASRAVGELLASGRIGGPVHRVVYSDGTVHPNTVEELSMEVNVKNVRGKANVEARSMVSFELEHPPLEVLSKLQGSMFPLLREERPDRIGLVAGIDLSSKGDDHAAAMSVTDPEGRDLGGLCLRGQPGLPYISGLLFYREAPLILPLILKAAESGLIDDNTLCVLDGNGILHPLRMGLACQVGASLGSRTCGVAKRLLMGSVMSDHETLGNCNVSAVMDGTERIGSALRVHGSSRAVYTSRGHRTDRETVDRTISMVMLTRIPEPIRSAHDLANRCRSETPS
ncbi:MAG: endonuclease V [Candidatus Thermoplasmatota archaeon]|nr:endonuclease V [Candidatus Thermoplasmatota archaeon]